MRGTGRPSISKRQKEQARLERQRDKAARRQQRKLERQSGTSPSTDPADESTGATPESAAESSRP
jgi:hypothetical protein